MTKTAQRKMAERVADAVDTFPPMPASVIELREAVADPDADYSRLVPALKRDPGLCADLLAFANSAKNPGMDRAAVYCRSSGEIAWPSIWRPDGSQ